MPGEDATSRSISPGVDATDITLETYEATAERFRELGMMLFPQLRRFLDQLVERAGASADVLELGSGPGRDASYLESRGLRVQRTDATKAFVALLRADGFDARVLDVRTDAFGGPYEAVMANAVLLHLSRSEFTDAVARARDAVVEGGLLALTLKEGDGEGWTNAKLGLPRHFTYWREQGVRDALVAGGWRVESIEHVAGHLEPWLYVFARR